MSFLQDHPVWLERAYAATEGGLRPFRRWLRRGGWIEQALIAGEELGKGVVFDCRMCGSCVLHSTGMTCPMTCPKNMRNGPCGGVQQDGRCEILRERPCIWVQAWSRSEDMPHYGAEVLTVLPPLDQRLQGGSAWIHEFEGLASEKPAGWQRP
ncbi:MAG: methylenetetrahydrofolate reductase C-terminal domain-containing protein [Anaerolineales bacterium]|nr:methylenetetrahydrofolate reductase C-terminal domain-containing protein [Anaerolineales bacterium]